MAVAMLERATRLVFAAVRDPRSDTELLTRFCRERDGWSFSELVRRHGPTVLGVCRRVLGDHHLAEDAFQASFLVLARKAETVNPPGAVGAWLYGVAYRTALKARGRSARRHEVEQAYGEVVRQQGQEMSSVSDTVDSDLRAAIDAHLNALPSRYRLPLVLCGVQGLGKSEAAERLGVPEGTVSSRLARGRAMLRDRLQRHGYVVPAAGLTALLLPRSLSANVPSSLASATAAAGPGFAAGSTAGVAAEVLSLTHEVLRTMSLIKWNLLSVLAVLGILAGGIAGNFTTSADEKKPVKPAATSPDKPKPEGEKPSKPKPTEGDKPKKPGEGEPGVRINGKAEKVDAAAGTISLMQKSDKGKTEQVMKVAADAKILVDGKPAKLGDIPAGAFVILMITGKGEPATGVIATGAQLSGVIAKVEGSNVTLEARGKENPKPDTFAVSSETRLFIAGKTGTAADLKVGQFAGVQLSLDGKTAIAMKVGQPSDGEKPVKKPDGDKKPVVKPDGDKKPTVKPDGDKKPTVKPDGDKKPTVKPDGDKKPVVKPDGDKKTGTKPVDK